MFNNITVIEELPHEPMQHGLHSFRALPHVGCNFAIPDGDGGRFLFEVTRIKHSLGEITAESPPSWMPRSGDGNFTLFARLVRHAPSEPA